MTVAYNSSTTSITGGTGYPEGYKLGRAVTDKVALYGVTPVIQPTASAQAAVTTATIAAATLATPTITAFGFTSAQAAALLTAQDALVTRVNLLSAQNAAFRTALVAVGVLKGAA